MSAPDPAPTPAAAPAPTPAPAADPAKPGEWKNPLDDIVWPDLSEWRTGKSGNRVYYINVKTKKSQWIKPDPITAHHKALKTEQDLIEKLAKEHPVWEAKKDRFGRYEYRNKHTNSKTLDKPYDFWTHEEKMRKKEEDEKKRKEEEEKARLAKIKESKVQPKNRAIVATIDALREVKEPSNLSDLEKGGQLVPLIGLARSHDAVLEFFKKGKVPEVLKEYDSARAQVIVRSDEIKGPEDHRYGSKLMEELFFLSLLWTEPKGMFPLRALGNITLYLHDSVVFDNMYTIPTYPGDSKFNPAYYKNACVGEDLDRSGYSLRRVDPEKYVDAAGKRQAVLEADESEKPRYSDEQWGLWWAKKMKIKEEMMAAIRQRAFGVAE